MPSAYFSIRLFSFTLFALLLIAGCRTYHVENHIREWKGGSDVPPLRVYVTRPFSQRSKLIDGMDDERFDYDVNPLLAAYQLTDDRPARGMLVIAPRSIRCVRTSLGALMGLLLSYWYLLASQSQRNLVRQRSVLPYTLSLQSRLP